jgi:hypothetical protein
MTPAPAYPPGASPSPESPPPFARGPSPAATAAKPIPPPADTRLPPALTDWSHGVRPPAASAVPMRAPAASSGGTSEDFQQIPCHSIPHPLPSLSTPPFGHPLPRPSAGPFAPEWVYAVRRGVYPGRQTPSRSRVGSHCFRSGGCPLRHTLQTLGSLPDSRNNYASRIAGYRIHIRFSKHEPAIPPYCPTALLPVALLRPGYPAPGTQYPVPVRRRGPVAVLQLVPSVLHPVPYRGEICAGIWVCREKPRVHRLGRRA